MNEKKHDFYVCMFLIVSLICGVVAICTLISYNNKSVTKQYSLSELEDGVYGIYTVTSSSIPAQNYEIITLCINGTVCTFKGRVNIHYAKNEYRVIVTDKNAVNSDVMDVYVPYGTVTYSNNIGIGG